MTKIIKFATFSLFISRSCAALLSLQGILYLLCKLAQRTYSFKCPPDILGAPYSLHARWGGESFRLIK